MYRERQETKNPDVISPRVPTELFVSGTPDSIPEKPGFVPLHSPLRVPPELFCIRNSTRQSSGIPPVDIYIFPTAFQIRQIVIYLQYEKNKKSGDGN